MRQGIMCIGTTVLDIIKYIDYLPNKNCVSTIYEIKQAVGGNVPNVLIDLAVLEKSLPLYAVGYVGDDQGGEYILDKFQQHNINIDYMKKLHDVPTSQSDIMTLNKTGERTVFYYRGASALLNLEYLKRITTDCKIVQIAYIGSLTELEQKDPEYNYKIINALDHFSKQGCKTSIDIISIDFDDEFRQLFQACFPFTDYLVANEIESSLCHNIELRDSEGTLVRSNIKKVLEQYITLGVRECAVIHCPEMAAYLDRSGKYIEIDSYFLDPNEIKGAVGAGDAFTAAFLYAMHEEIDPTLALKYGHACARYNLLDASAVEGAVSLETIKKFIANHKEI